MKELKKPTRDLFAWQCRNKCCSSVSFTQHRSITSRHSRGALNESKPKLIRPRDRFLDDLRLLTNSPSASSAFEI